MEKPFIRNVTKINNLTKYRNVNEFSLMSLETSARWLYTVLSTIVVYFDF